MEPSVCSLAIMLVAVWLVEVKCQWSNDLGGMLSRSCMYGFGITTVKSQYAESGGDRLWEIGCSQIGLLRGDDVCRWTYEFQNEPGKKLKYSCQDNEYISGLYSDYNSTAQDRVWRIECCNSPGMTVSNCAESSDWVNKYTEDLDLVLEPKYVLQGVASVYKQEKRDRKWKFTICDVRKQSTENQNPPEPDSE